MNSTKRTIATFILAAMLIEGSRAGAAGEPKHAQVEIGLAKQLVVDDFAIAEMHNVIRNLGTVRKMGVVLRPSLPTDFGETNCKPTAFHMAHYLTVLRNEKDDKFQMWYLAHADHGIGYAE